MNVGSLFSGVGGLDLGLARAGFTHRFFCESDPWRRSVLAAHWPGVPIYEDVRDVGLEDGRWPVGYDPADSRGASAAPQARHDVDLLCGGFPCQDLSVAGQRKGLAGERSGLFHEFARIADALRPSWLLVENVPGLLSSNGGRDFGIVLGTLADLGYGVAWRVVDSRFFGVPQRRRRVFILGARADGDSRAAAERAGEILAVGTRCDRHFAARGEARTDVAGALGGSVGTGRGHDGNPFDRGGHSSLSGLGSGGPDDNDAQAGRIVAWPLARRGRDGGADLEVGEENVYNSLRAGNGGSYESLIAVTGFSHTQGLDAQPSSEAWPSLRKEGGGMGVGVGVRRLTPIECERLQAWPDGWTNPNGDAPDSRRYAACGDGVTASVAEWIGRRLMGAA